MRIAKKDVERLEYVERALSKRDDHLAKVVHNVLHELNPEFVYVVVEEGSWDYESTSYAEVYASFGDALNSAKNLLKIAEQEMFDYTNEDSIIQREQINEEKQTASFKIYEDGDFARLHDTIKIIKKEVI